MKFSSDKERRMLGSFTHRQTRILKLTQCVIDGHALFDQLLHIVRQNDHHQYCLWFSAPD